MKYDFFEFLEVEALLFLCTFVFALMHCALLALISFAFFHIMALLYPLAWIISWAIKKYRNKTHKIRRLNNA